MIPLCMTSFDHPGATMSVGSAFYTGGLSSLWQASTMPTLVPGLMGGGKAIKGGAALRRIFIGGAQKSVTVRVRQLVTSVVADQELFGIGDASGGTRVRCKAGGVVQMITNATSHDSAAFTMLPNQVYTFELAVTFSTTTGATALKVDGLTDASLAFSGIHTGAALADRLLLHDNFLANLPNANCTSDDLLVRGDPAIGFVNGDLLSDAIGNPFLATIMPAAPGFYGDWDVVGAPSIWEALAEVPSNGVTSHIKGKASGGVVGDKASWKHGALSLAAGAVIHGAATHFFVGGNLSSNQQVRHGLRMGGVDYPHADTPGTIDAINFYPEERQWQDPAAAGPFTPSSISDLEVYVEKLGATPIPPGTSVASLPLMTQAALVVAYSVTPVPDCLMTFDLVTEETAARVSVRRQIVASGLPGPRFTRQADDRPIREYVITIRQARPQERMRLQDLWSLSRFGTIPMCFTHPQDGQVHVVFAENPLRWLQTSARFASIEVRLREVPGA